MINITYITDEDLKFLENLLKTNRIKNPALLKAAKSLKKKLAKG